MSTATVTIEAFAAKDATLKFTPSGRPVLEFDLPVTPQKKNERGEWEDTGETAWYRCSLWGPMAETLQIPKGTLVQVVGTLRVRTYESRDGKTSTALEVNVKSLGILRESRNAAPSTQPGKSMAGHAGYAERPPANDPWAPSGNPTDPPF